MLPSFPCDIHHGGNTMMRVVNPLSCGMIRFDLACGNAAFDVLCIPAVGGALRLIPMCQLCVDDSLAADSEWLEDISRSCRVIVRERRKVNLA